MLALLITLNGWTQHSTNWSVLGTTNKDTIIQYNFNKKEIRNLRLYISYLEWSNSIGIELNDVNEKIIKKQENEILTCKQLVNNRDSIINLQTKIINENDKLNASLKQQVVKYKNRAAK